MFVFSPCMLDHGGSHGWNWVNAPSFPPHCQRLLLHLPKEMVLRMEVLKHIWCEISNFKGLPTPGRQKIVLCVLHCSGQVLEKASGYQQILTTLVNMLDTLLTESCQLQHLEIHRLSALRQASQSSATFNLPLLSPKVNGKGSPLSGLPGKGSSVFIGTCRSALHPESYSWLGSWDSMSSRHLHPVQMISMLATPLDCRNLPSATCTAVISDQYGSPSYWYAHSCILTRMKPSGSKSTCKSKFWLS